MASICCSLPKACRLPALALAKARKEIVHLLELPLPGRAPSRRFSGRRAARRCAVLRHEGETPPSDSIGRPALHRLAIEHDAPVREASSRPRSGSAWSCRAVPSQERHRLTGAT